MGKMHAAVIHRHGTLDELHFQEIDRPQVDPGHILVRARAVALNRLDLFVLEGIPGVNLEMPHVMGSDGAGIVEEVGQGVSRLEPGDQVMLNPGLSCGQCEFCVQGEHSLCIGFGLMGEHTGGTFAQYFQAPEANFERMPSGVSFEEAAAFSLVTQTAWRMLKTRARLRAGEDVFIHGIGGGVASAALQIAVLSGARTFVSSSSETKLEQARELGADHCFNYTTADVAKEVYKLTGKRGVDVVVEGPGAATWLQSLKMVRKGGRIVTCGATTGANPQTELRLIFWKQIEILGSSMSSRREYQEIIELLSKGKLRPVIDRVFPLSQARDAIEFLQNQSQFGKIVLQVES
jgi:NADPH:quinone reductase-like Zn-dependent oxidoreductase